jgi:hypothetical protein
VSRSSYAAPHPQPLARPFATADASQPDPRAPLAGLLSFLFPGLGQAYNGQAALAGILAAPALVIVVGAALTVMRLRTALQRGTINMSPSDATFEDGDCRDWDDGGSAEPRSAPSKEKESSTSAAQQPLWR